MTPARSSAALVADDTTTAPPDAVAVRGSDPTDDLRVDDLVEDVSIDGMCGVY